MGEYSIEGIHKMQIADRPAVSVIIATYNCEKYIHQSVMSVCYQPSMDWELIVIDDGSTDNTTSIIKKICKDYPQVVYEKLPQKGGVSKARNRGIEISTGRYVMFLDADDLWVKGFYDDNLASILRKEEYDIFRFSTLSADENLRYGKKYTLKKAEGVYGDKVFLENRLGGFVEYAYKRSLIGDNIRFPEGIPLGEDIVFFNKLYYKAKTFRISSRLMYIVRVRGNSVSRSLQSDEVYKNHNSFFIARELYALAKEHVNKESGTPDEFLIRRAAEFALNEYNLGYEYKRGMDGVDDTAMVRELIEIMKESDEINGTNYLNNLRETEKKLSGGKQMIKKIKFMLRRIMLRISYVGVIRGVGYRLHDGIRLKEFIVHE